MSVREAFGLHIECGLKGRKPTLKAIACMHTNVALDAGLGQDAEENPFKLNRDC